MTDKYDERAKQITIYCENNYAVGPKNWYSEIEPMIAAALREAVLKARVEMREGLVYDEGVAWGKASAYADAAKMADECCMPCMALCCVCAELPRKIRARAKDVAE